MVTKKQHEKLIKKLERDWKAALRREENETDVEKTWRLAATSDGALRRLRAAQAGVELPTPNTARNRAKAAFAALALIGKSIGRAVRAKASLAKATAVRAAKLARRSLRRALVVIVAVAVALASTSNRETQMKNTEVKQQLWKYTGISVTPNWKTKRHVAGGEVVDVRVHDYRSTTSEATVNVANLNAVDVYFCRCSEPTVVMNDPTPCRVCGGVISEDFEFFSPTVLDEAEKVMNAWSEKAAADEGFDGGEFSGPARDAAEHRELCALASRYGVAVEELLAAVDRRRYEDGRTAFDIDESEAGLRADAREILDMMNEYDRAERESAARRLGKPGDPDGRQRRAIAAKLAAEKDAKTLQWIPTVKKEG